MRKVLAAVLIFAAVASVPVAGQENEDVALAFSFWRNLTNNGDNISIGQTVTLIRGGRLVGTGKLDDTIWENIPWKTRNRKIYFEVSDLPDSVNAGNGPPTVPASRDSIYDLFVIGDVKIEELSLLPRDWRGHVSVKDVIEDAVSERVISYLDLYPGRDSSGRQVLITPDSLASIYSESCDFVEYVVEGRAKECAFVQTIRNRNGEFWPQIIHVEFGPSGSSTVLGGVVDFFFEIGGSPYMVTRSWRRGTGMWGYSVFKIHLLREPELVYFDGSWSN